jgi:hypothetical protein
MMMYVMWCILGMIFCESLSQLWRELHLDLDDDLQGFPNKETSKSEILDVVGAMRSSDNTDHRRHRRHHHLCVFLPSLAQIMMHCNLHGL